MNATFNSILYTFLFFIQWTWICNHNNTLAFSTFPQCNSAPNCPDKYTNSFSRHETVKTLSFLASPSIFQHPGCGENFSFSLQARKSISLDVSTSNQQDSRYLRRIISREKFHKLRVTLKEYLITKPRSFFRQETSEQLMPIRTEHDDASKFHESGLLEKTDTSSSRNEQFSLTQHVEHVAETIISDDDVSLQLEDSYVEKSPTAVLDYPPIQEEEEEDIASSHERWALSAKDVDFTGLWKIIVSEDFKNKYDVYLARLGQPALVRSIAVGIVEYTSEHIHHSGCEVTIRGKNLRGAWDRTLISSGWNDCTKKYISDVSNPIKTADSETVKAESWWEDNGKVHVSWMKGVKKYGGGEFESRRYLEQNGQVLVCESTFHQNNVENRSDKATITWKFKRSD